MIRPAPSLARLEERLAADPSAVPTLDEARRIQEGLRREALRLGAWPGDADLTGDLALARALRGLPPVRRPEST